MLAYILNNLILGFCLSIYKTMDYLMMIYEFTCESCLTG